MQLKCTILAIRSFVFAMLGTLLAGMTGCAVIGDQVADEVASAVSTYCEEPQSARQVYREIVNEELAVEGHTITVVCSGDDPG